MSIHDVAPATWSDCLHLLHAVRAVADIPLSWLVVPCYHHNAMRSLACEATLEKLMGEGHELVLHGYTHVDRVPLRGIGPGRLLRTLYTQREGEFAAIGRDEARRRLTLGMRWFQERAWPVSGFVAPSLAAGAARLAGLARVSVPLHHQLCAFSLAAAVGAQPGGAGCWCTQPAMRADASCRHRWRAAWRRCSGERRWCGWPCIRATPGTRCWCVMPST
ncbi:DUF2334 domain-containing protein [Massilia sp. B-10]|nr:DUF2334 domain-containing protein [Massilia sp. B-10]